MHILCCQHGIGMTLRTENDVVNLYPRLRSIKRANCYYSSNWLALCQSRAYSQQGHTFYLSGGKLAHLAVSLPAEKQVQSIGSILSKLLTSVEQQSTALTLYPDPLSETRAVLERLGHKVAALETRLAETHLVFETKLQETDSDLSEMKEQILLGQAAYTFASLVEGFVSGGASTRDLQTLSLKEESTLTVA